MRMAFALALLAVLTVVSLLVGVIDLRNNGGGEDEAGRLIASYFTDAEAPYMKVRYKNGPSPNDFETVREWSSRSG